MKKFILMPIISIVLLLSIGCTDKNGTVKALHENGFTNVETHGRSFFGCSNDDSFATKWSALNQKGERVEGVACAGFFKGTTLRFK